MDERMRWLPIVTISKTLVGTEHSAQARADSQREGEKEPKPAVCVAFYSLQFLCLVFSAPE